MPDVVIAGAGVVGLAAALLLAKDRHRVTVLERDRAAPAEDPEAAWTSWQRRGVSQFRQLHYFQPRFRAIVEGELPEVAEALDRAGALRFNPVRAAPAALSAGGCPGDEAFTALTARRPVVESVLARVAADAPGITVRRGTAVTRLITGTPAAAGVCHVAGVGLQDGTELRADLVVDATGRRSRLPALLVAIGAPPPIEEREDCGFVYYARHFRQPAATVCPGSSPQDGRARRSAWRACPLTPPDARSRRARAPGPGRGGPQHQARPPAILPAPSPERMICVQPPLRLLSRPAIQSRQGAFDPSAHALFITVGHSRPGRGGNGMAGRPAGSRRRPVFGRLSASGENGRR